MRYLIQTLLVIVAVIFFTPAYAYAPPYAFPEAPGRTEAVEVAVEQPPTPPPAITPLLERIAICESGGRQFNADGSVLRGKVNPKDTGKWQLNLDYHQATANKLGHDLFTLEGNTDYAVWLYQQQGTTPWNWSKPCWSGKI